MRSLTKQRLVAMGLLIGFTVLSINAQAAIDNTGVLDDVLRRYSTAAAGWNSVITGAASRLFWSLVTISMVWTFGLMALRRADISEIFAELFRFTVTTGFFWWALTNGPNFASSIYDSLRQIGGQATGLGSALGPSGIVDIGFSIFGKVADNSTIWEPVDSIVMMAMAAAILVILALVAINMLMLLISGWILAYGGVFFLGFGGSRWTSDMAINYYKTVVGLAGSLLGMVLIVGIGKTFLDDYYSRMSAGLAMKDMGVLLVITITLLVLTNKIPGLISGIVTGAGIRHIGEAGAGTAMAAAGMAAGAAAAGGAMMAAGAASIAGGGQAIMAAFSKASENVGAGSDIVSQWTGGGGGGTTESGSSSDNGSSSAFSQAAGISSGGESGGSGGSASGGESGGSGGSASGGESGSSGGSASGGESGSSGGSASGPSGFSKAGRIAADAVANLAAGVSDVAKEKAGGIRDAAKDRISETLGGKVAAAIMNDSGAAAVAEFAGDSLSGDKKSDPTDEVADFANRHLA